MYIWLIRTSYCKNLQHNTVLEDIQGGSANIRFPLFGFRSHRCSATIHHEAFLEFHLRFDIRTKGNFEEKKIWISVSGYDGGTHIYMLHPFQQIIYPKKKRSLSIFPPSYDIVTMFLAFFGVDIDRNLETDKTWPAKKCNSVFIQIQAGSPTAIYLTVKCF